MNKKKRCFSSRIDQIVAHVVEYQETQNTRLQESIIKTIIYISNKPSREVSEATESALELYGDRIPEFYKKIISRCILSKEWGTKSFVIRPRKKEVA